MHMVITTALPLYCTMIMLFWISLVLLVWMRLMVLMLMMSVLPFMTMMILTMILMRILMIKLMMILLTVGEGTCILPKFPAAAVNIFCANGFKKNSAGAEHRHLAPRGGGIF